MHSNWAVEHVPVQVCSRSTVTHTLTRFSQMQSLLAIHTFHKQHSSTASPPAQQEQVKGLLLCFSHFAENWTGLGNDTYAGGQCSMAQAYNQSSSANSLQR